MAFLLQYGFDVQKNDKLLHLGSMLLQVNTRDPHAVAAQVIADVRLMFPGTNHAFVQEAFGWASKCFTGRMPGYLPVDARYHDFEHTLQGTLCFSSLLRGRFQMGEKPVIPASTFRLGLMAILLHDTGYLKRTGDTEGTGAKYTVTHVDRSCEFSAEFLANHGFSPRDIRSIHNMIRCTGVDAEIQRIPFGSEDERIVGFALGTADLIGQMAAPDYVEKLPVLYEEFVEAARFNGQTAASIAGFASAEDLRRKTPGFWEGYVRPKIERDFLGLHRFLANPVPDGPNNYIACVERNIRRLRAELSMAA